MKPNSSRRFSNSHADNQKFKIQSRKWAGSFVIALICVLVGTRAEAQQPKKVTRLGYLSSSDPASESTRSEAIRRALHEFGYIEGQNIATVYRHTEGKPDRLPEVTAELVRLKVDIIVVAGGTGRSSRLRMRPRRFPLLWSALVSILSRQVWLKALPGPAATSLGSQTFQQNLAESDWSCSRKPFPKSSVSRSLRGRSVECNEVKGVLPVAARPLGLNLQPWEVRAGTIRECIGRTQKERPHGL